MLPTLYSKGKKGELRFWKVYTEGAEIITAHGVVDGKTQIARKTAKAKNVGKANETTPEQQALSQAQSMWNKQIDKGYFDSIEKAQNTEVFLPMLAAKFDEKKHNIDYPCVVQPKLDGVRCLAYWDTWETNTIKLMSRGGKLYDVQHISEACKLFLSQNQVFDGELYIHGMPLQDINSLVKKPQEGSLKLEFWVYDTFYRNYKDLSWTARLADLEELYKHPEFEESPLMKVPWGQISAEDQVRKAEKYWVEQGFEGAIIRDFRGTYEIGKRSNYLLKVKSFLDEEFEIVGYKEGEGKFEGCVVWECRTREGKTFHVTPKGTMEQRAKWFQTGDEYIGKLLTVQFFQWTNDNLPQFPVGVSLRLSEDM